MLLRRIPLWPRSRGIFPGLTRPLMMSRGLFLTPAHIPAGFAPGLPFLIATMAGPALEPKVPTPRTPGLAADVAYGVGDALPRPVIYQPCRTMLWLAYVGACLQGEEPQ